ncbi:MAG: phytoene/squalene synthase family protein [Jatrophihabitans sp.]
MKSDYDAAGITDPVLRADYEYCRSLAQTHGQTYFLATRLLPADRRPAVHALYGFARTADDIVDDLESSTSQRAGSLDGLARDLRRDRPVHPASRAVVDAVRRHGIDPDLHDQFLHSMRMDLTVTQYETFADLEGYMRGSAAAIGMQLLPILGTVGPSEAAEPYAAALGVAFQMTNFIRDVGEDLDRGRIYLPQESMRAHGVTPEHLQELIVDEPVRALLRDEVARTREIYAFAEPGIERLAPVARECVRTAFVLYRDILGEVERHHYRVLDRRVVVPMHRRISVAGPNLARAVRLRLRRPRAGDGSTDTTPTA